jgi:hypothetical protein
MDKWGETWTYSDINNSNFGVVLSADLILNDMSLARVDHIQITVYYTEATPANGLSCSITTSAGCVDTVLLRMSDSLPLGSVDSTPGYNAQAELPSQSTATYDDYVVCCSGITGLGNSCSGNHEVFARLSGVTNAHVEKNSEAGTNYTENACLSSKVGDIITIGYQPTNCDGYDTTLFSMSNTPTNSMVGIPASYNNKVCAKVFSASLSLEISSDIINFGTLTTGATGKGSHTVQVSSNANSGFALTYSGADLISPQGTIDAYGSLQDSVAGIEGFGINMKNNDTPDIGAELVENSGTCDAPATDYATKDKFSYTAGATTPLTTQDGPADCTYTVSYVANISMITPAGSYSAPITYIVSGTF